LDANGGFTWTRKISKSRGIRVYFTVDNVQSTVEFAPRPLVEAFGSTIDTSVLVTGVTRNIASGSTVKPWIKINGGKAFRGIPVQVAADGTFVWTYLKNKGDQIRVKFNVRGVKSDPINL
jgi:hypothetical protein